MAIVGKGWGYWDVTHHPYGGCFNRVEAECEVEVIGPAGKFPKIETKVRFNDGTIGILPNRAFLPKQ